MISTSRSNSKFTSSERLAVICFSFLAVISPLYIGGREDPEVEEETEPFNLATWLPLLLILAIAFSLYLDRSFTKFDPNWIHRVGGSSGGILAILLLLGLVLKCKESILS
ncbi:unnamed protein product [Linum trigynum]|uniref:Transmembrane protein n=1 Tax=Linum trigynum TaxID=586398 RepID=A0AAV2DAT2_9ROSI